MPRRPPLRGGEEDPGLCQWRPTQASKAVYGAEEQGEGYSTSLT